MRFGLIALLVLPAMYAETLPPAETPGQETIATDDLRNAVESFKVLTSNLGMRIDSTHKLVRAQTHAEWHGRVYWNVRNDIFDAVPHEVTQTGGDKEILRRNQYGFSISGPVLIPKIFHGRNRTFFTVTYEGVRQNEGRSFLETIATRQESLGDFSRTVDKAGELLRIYDPNTTRLNPGFDPSQPVSAGDGQYLRDVFPDNRIPAARLDPVAIDALQHYPGPNVSIGPFFQNNYTNYTPERNEADGFRAAVDHNISDQQRISVGLNISNGLEGAAQVYDSIASPSRADRRYRNREVSVDHTYTIAADKVNNFQVEAQSTVSETERESSGSSSPFPVFSFSPYLGMGRSDPRSRLSETGFEIENAFSMRWGSHSIQIDGGIEWDLENGYEPQYPAGSFSFGEGITSLPGIVNTGHSFAAFLLGLAEGAEESLVQHPSYWRQLEWDIGFQDEWQVRPGLTVSFGVDLDVSHAAVEKYDRQSTVDLEVLNPANGRPGALVFANRDGYGRRFQPTRYLVQPQFGVAWSPFAGSRTVVRFGFERSMDGFGTAGGHWGTQGFNGLATYFTQNEQLEPAVVLQDGLPDGSVTLPDLRPEAANDTDAYLLDLSGRLPISHSYEASMEHQLAGSVILRFGMDYSHGWNQGADSGASPNAIPLDALQHRDLLYDEQFNRSLRPYPQYRIFDLDDFYVGAYRGTEIEVSVQKRTAQGLSLQFEYEFSRRMDNYDGELQDYYHREKEWALSDSTPHEISLQYMYELPFGPGKRHWTAGWPSVLFGGWTISGTSSYSSGEPIELRARFNNTGGVVRALYVNGVPGLTPHVQNEGPERWFNPNAFVNPTDFAIGTVSRRHPSLRNPAHQNHDLAVAKRFRLSSDREIEFVGTALNFLNHANWNDPDSEIGSFSSPNINAGRIIGSRGGRIIQLGLRFSF